MACIAFVVNECHYKLLEEKAGTAFVLNEVKGPN
jgi:hypothetical protein